MPGPEGYSSMFSYGSGIIIADGGGVAILVELFVAGDRIPLPVFKLYQGQCLPLRKGVGASAVIMSRNCKPIHRAGQNPLWRNLHLSSFLSNSGDNDSNSSGDMVY